MDVFESGRTVALFAMASGMFAFLAIYLRLKFYRHFVGRALAVFATNFALISSLGFTYRVRPDWPGEDEIKFIAYWSMAIATWWLLGSLIRQRRTDLMAPQPYVDPEQPESWYWIEYRPSGFWTALEPPENCHWLLVRNDLELEWFQDVGDAAEALTAMVVKDLSIVSAMKRQRGNV